jgi:ABC-type nitrate/sulfonate/bicarbonate transport system substrate-binding protein
VKKNVFKMLSVFITFVLVLVLLGGCSAGAANKHQAGKAASNVSNAASVAGSSSSTPSGSQEASSEPINLSIFSVSVSGLEIPTWVALDNKLFEKYGINPKWTTLPPPTGVQALLSKDVQIGAVPGDAISAYASGSKDLIFVAGNNDKPVYKVMTNKLTKPEDLLGKKIGVSGKYAPPAIALMNYLEKQFNLKVDKDYKLVTFQTISDVLPALDKGLIDAGVLSTPLDLKSQKQGAKVLVDLSKTFDEAHAYIMTTKKFAKENPDTVLRFLKAYAAGLALAKKNPDTAVASILKHQTGITNEEARITYEDYIHLQDINMTPEAIKPYQIYNDNPKAKSVNAADLFDYSFLEQLDKSGFLKENGFTLKVPKSN